MSASVEVADLSYRYPDGTQALRGVSLRLERGECVGLVGPNGSGKSTLLLHLNGLLPEGGEGCGRVSIDGAVVARANLAHVRRSVGLLFQDADDQLFCPTVFEDVAFGPRQFGPAEVSGSGGPDQESLAGIVARALAQVGLSGFEARAPGRLSGGEKRLACLAGVLACQPGVLVPRVIVLDGGAIVAQGPTAVILADEALMLAHGLERPHILQHRHPHDAGPPAAGQA